MNTKNIVSELLATGLTQYQLANLVPCSQSLINALLNGQRGARTSFLIAKRLLDLHAQLCAEKSGSAPSIAEAESTRNGGLRLHGDGRDAKNIGE